MTSWEDAYPEAPPLKSFTEPTQAPSSGSATAQPAASWEEAYPEAPPVKTYAEPAAAPPQHPHTTGSTGRVLEDFNNIDATQAARVMGGLLATPRAIAQGVDYLGKHVPYVGGDIGADRWLSSLRDPTDRTKPMFPDYETAKAEAFNTFGGSVPEGSGGSIKIGLPKPTEYVPTTYAGRRAMDATTAATMAAIGSPVTSASVIPRSVGQVALDAAAVAPTALGGATSSAAAEAYPEHPFIAGMLGFIPGQRLGSALTTAPQRIIQAVRSGGEATEPYGAFTRLGLPTDLSGTVTGNPTLKGIEGGSGTTLAGNRAVLLDAWKAKIGSEADKLGKSATQQELGDFLQNQAGNWKANWESEGKNLWSDFDNKMPPGTRVEVPGYWDALDKVMGKFSGAPKTGEVLQPATVKRLYDALNLDLNGGTSIPLESLQAARSEIGKRITNPGIDPTITQKDWNTIYRGLSSDLKAGASAAGPEAEAAFTTANDFTRNGHGIIKDTLGPILDAPTPEQAATYALAQAKKGGTRVTDLETTMPGTAGELGSFTLRDAAGADTSPTSFVRAMPRLSPEARAAMFPQGTPIAELTATGKIIKGFENDVTPDHSTGKMVGAIEGARAGHELFGVPGAIGGGVLGYAGGGASPGALLRPMLGPRTSALAASLAQKVPYQAIKPALRTKAAFGSTLGQ